MRLIDADALKQLTEESIAEYGNDYYTGDMIYGMQCVVHYATTDAPTVDAVPVIRCKDCKHRKRQFGKDVYCQLVSNVMPPDGYCSMAVGKEGK